MNGYVIIAGFIIVVISVAVGFILFGGYISDRKRRKRADELLKSKERILQFLRKSGFSGGDEFLMLDEIVNGRVSIFELIKPDGSFNPAFSKKKNVR